MAQTVNDDIQDWMIRHSAWLNRYSAGEANKILELTKKADKLINKEIRGTDDLTKKSELNALLVSVWAIEEKASERYIAVLNKDLQEFSEYESGFQARGIEKSLKEVAKVEANLTLPDPARMWVAINSRPLTGEGLNFSFMQDLIKSIPESRLSAIETTINTGYTLGWSNDKIAREIYGDLGSINKPRNWTKTVTRTSINHTSSVSREMTWKENKTIVKGYEWNSTLDGRTSYICASLDGKVWRYDIPSRSTLDGQRMPPAHPNCRSTTIPFLYDWREMGVDPGERSSLTGYIPASVKFPKWFESQSAAFQKDWLGASRYQAWKNGKIKIDDLVKNNKPLTLEQLKVKEI